MAPELAPTPLAEQPWFAEFLESRGFRKIAPATFSNGRASVRLDGSTLYAVPGDDDKKVWRTQIKETPPESIRQLLTVVLAAPSFLSQAELDQRAGRERQAEVSLGQIAAAIRDNPDGPEGQQLRRFVWSIFNQHHAVNLWRMKEELGPQQSQWVADVLIAWLEGNLSDSTIRSALEDSGEMDRWDNIRLQAPEQRRLADAIDAVSDITKATPPGPSSPALTRANDLLREVANLLRNIQKSGG